MERKTYFKNIPEIGDLTLDYVFAESDCPIIFTLKDKKNKLYFCVCTLMTGRQVWVLRQVMPKEISRYINNEISSYDLFKKYHGGIYVLSWNYGYKQEQCDIFSSVLVPDEVLPQKDVYFYGSTEEMVDALEHFFPLSDKNQKLLETLIDELNSKSDDESYKELVNAGVIKN